MFDELEFCAMHFFYSIFLRCLALHCRANIPFFVIIPLLAFSF